MSTQVQTQQYLPELITGVLTLLGVLVGLLAEPVKLSFSNRNQRKNLRRALYSEMSNMYDNMYSFLTTVDVMKSVDGFMDDQNVMEIFKSNLRMDCYNHAVTQPMVFYLLPEASSINAFYSHFQLILKGNFPLASAVEYSKMAMIGLEINMQNGIIDKRLMRKVSSPAARERMKKGFSDAWEYFQAKYQEAEAKAKRRA